jgi:hypothetical protein
MMISAISPTYISYAKHQFALAVTFKTQQMRIDSFLIGAFLPPWMHSPPTMEFAMIIDAPEFYNDGHQLLIVSLGIHLLLFGCAILNGIFSIFVCFVFKKPSKRDKSLYLLYKPIDIGLFNLLTVNGPSTFPVQ